ncbi:MAG: undecaprenyl-phosphate glucose phosphotransferase [Pseudomonadota bacterium]
MALIGSPQASHHAFFNAAVGLICAGAIACSLGLCVGVYNEADFGTFNFIGLAGIGAGFVAFNGLGAYLLDAQVNWRRLAWATIRRWVAAFFAVLFIIYLSKTGNAVSRAVMVGWLCLTPFVLVPALVLCRRMAFRMYSGPQHRRKAVFVMLGDEGQRLADKFRRAPILGIAPVGYFDNRIMHRSGTGPGLERLGTVAEAREWFANHRVDMVFIGLQNSQNENVAPLVESLLDSVVSIYFVPDYKFLGEAHLAYTEIANTSLLVAYETPFLGLARLSKRTMDLILSGLILLLVSPIMVAAAIAVRLSSPGPILFRQKRYGAGGVEISVYKFRSMREAPPAADGRLRQATQNDDRVTRVGRFLRKSSIDELPQFFNVLGGSMSIVGPRPHAVQHNELYRRQVRGYMLRHKVKPGITGWAQVNGLRGETATLDRMERRVEYDLYYIRNWSLMFDLRIIFMTALIVLRDRHAY